MYASLKSPLSSFGDPASLAVVGASDDDAKWGYWLARGALAGRCERKVWLINHNAVTVHGEPTYAHISQLPQAPELVVVCVPAKAVEEVVIDALAMGAQAFVIITAGVPDQQHLVARIRESGARLVGPNCLGLYDASSALQLTWGHFTAGALAVVSQSGQLGLEIADLGARAGIGISRFVSVGNQHDVNAADLLEDLVDHDATHHVALYLESFTDGARLVRAIRKLADAGKRTVILTTGASESSQRLARSHTGSMTSALDAVDAACRASGAIRVSTPGQLIDMARYLEAAPLPAGDRVAVISDSGGQGGIAADLVTGAGLSTPALSSQLQDKLASQLPLGASVANPVDLAGAGEADMHTYASLSEAILESGEIDVVILSGYLGKYGEDTPSTAKTELAVIDAIGGSAQRYHRPVLIHSMSSNSAAVDRMWDHGLPTFTRVERVVDTLRSAYALNTATGRGLMAPEPGDTQVGSGYWGARHTLSAHGIAIPRAVLVQQRSDLQVVHDELKGPFVLKAGWLEHKSEYRGIALGLTDRTSLEAAYEDMVARLGAGQYVVEEHDDREHVVEVLVGAQRDRHFGPMITVGGGGTEAELWHDVCTELAPVDLTTARAMIARLRVNALLTGWRGRPAVHTESLAAMIVAVSEAIVANPRVRECEINPVRVGVDGSLAVDALMTTC